MTRLEMASAIDRDSTVDAGPTIDFTPRLQAGAHLKCPACQAEVEQARPLPFDSTLRCKACAVQSEYRVWHEAWCASRREILIGAFPDLAWLRIGYADATAQISGRYEGLGQA